MKTLKRIMIILVSVLALLFLVGLFMPRDLRISEKVEINMPVTKVFSSIATFQDRQSWDPWLETDPAARVRISPGSDYVGSEYSWNGSRIGSGRMVVDSVDFGKHITNLIWFRPEGEPSVVTWDFSERDGITTAEWAIHFSSWLPYTRIMSQLMKSGMKKSLLHGLTTLKKNIEEKGITLSSLSDPEVREMTPVTALTTEGASTMNGISETLSVMFGIIMSEIETRQLQPAGFPFAKYFDYDESTATLRIMAGIEVERAEGTTLPAGISEIPGFMAVYATHVGPYDEFNLSYNRIMSYMALNGIQGNGVSWEFYQTDPSEVADPLKLITGIAFEISEQ